MKARRLAMLGLVLMAAVILVFFNVQKKTVTILDRGSVHTRTTFRGTVEGGLAACGYELDPRDRTFPARSEDLEDGMRIEIKRAFPVFFLEGETLRQVRTAAATVGEFLADRQVVLGELDRVEPSLETPLAPGDTVVLTRVREETLVVRETLPFETVLRKNPQMGTGETVCLQVGVDGEKLVTYEVVYENNHEISREKTGESVFREAVPELIEKGGGKLVAAARGELRFVKSMVMTSTAYDLSVESCGKTPDHPEYGITFTGTRARRGTVAVDPSVIPLGSRLYIESLDGTPDYGFAVAEDTGSAVKGDIIDLFMETEAEVAAYGKRKVRVYILE